MGKLSHLFFAFFSTVVLALASCSDEPKKLAPIATLEKPTAESKSSLPDIAQQLHQVRYTQSKGEKLQWELQADQVDQTLDGPTNLNKVKITYYSDDGKVTILTADSGQYNTVTRDAALQGNVVVEVSDGSKMTTEALKWSQSEELLRGEGDVTMIRGDSIVEGVGFELSPNLETFEMFSVKGIIRQGDVEL